MKLLMEWLMEGLQVLNSIIVMLCQFLAMVVLSIGIIKALKIYLADVLTPGRSADSIKASRLELGHSFPDAWFSHWCQHS